MCRQYKVGQGSFMRFINKSTDIAQSPTTTTANDSYPNSVKTSSHQLEISSPSRLSTPYYMLPLFATRIAACDLEIIINIIIITIIIIIITIITIFNFVIIIFLIIIVRIIFITIFIIIIVIIIISSLLLSNG